MTGVLAVAILVVNNLRDVPTDAVAGKRTLAVRLGEARTRQLFVGAIALGADARGRRRAARGPLGLAAARRARSMPLAREPVERGARRRPGRAAR